MKTDVVYPTENFDAFTEQKHRFSDSFSLSHSLTSTVSFSCCMSAFIVHRKKDAAESKAACYSKCHIRHKQFQSKNPYREHQFAHKISDIVIV